MGEIDYRSIDYYKKEKLDSSKKEGKKYKVKCISCSHEVEVIFPFRKDGSPFTANCPRPECGKLAYNSSKEEPPLA